MRKLTEEICDSGIGYFRNKISNVWIDTLREKAEESFKRHYSIQIKNGMENPNRWLALNAIGDCNEYLKFAEILVFDYEIEQFLTEYFNGSFILNSFSILCAKAGDDNFSLKAHRDSREYMNSTNLMINFLVLLDEFTDRNGATYILPRSHHKKEKPSDEYFYKNCDRVLGTAGDVLAFHSDVWHAAGRNLTDHPRRAIAMTFTKPYMKQLVDIPRMIGENQYLDPKMKKILGYTTRVPSNLDEWYQPIETRYYLTEK